MAVRIGAARRRRVERCAAARGGRSARASERGVVRLSLGRSRTAVAGRAAAGLRSCQHDAQAAARGEGGGARLLGRDGCASSVGRFSATVSPRWSTVAPRRSAIGPAIDERLRAAILAEAEGMADASDVRKMQFRARVASRWHGRAASRLNCPSSRQTFNRIVDEVLAPTGLFRRRRRAGAARRARRARIWGRWLQSGRVSTSRSTRRVWMCSRSTRSRSSGSGSI